MKFDVILADPPWQYTSKSVSPNREVTNHYQTMPTNKICELPVSEMASSQCALFLWATWPLLEDAIAVIKSWGFTYKTIAWVWVKAKKSGMGFFWGMGGYTRSNSEPCLLAFTDELPVKDHGVQSLIYSPVREHSRKPDEQYQKIEKLYPNMNYVELFARRKRPGWYSWGNEVESSPEVSALTMRGSDRASRPEGTQPLAINQSNLPWFDANPPGSTRKPFSVARRRPTAADAASLGGCHVEVAKLAKAPGCWRWNGVAHPKAITW